jgi:hypothetical protein
MDIVLWRKEGDQPFDKLRIRDQPPSFENFGGPGRTEVRDQRSDVRRQNTGDRIQ